MGDESIREAGLRPFAHNGRATLYRSRSLDNVGRHGVAQLRELGIAEVFDLRKPHEQRTNPLLAEAGIRVRSLDENLQDGPLLRLRPNAMTVRERYGAPGERMQLMYRTFAFRAQAFLPAVRAAAASPRPVLIHCQNGKDRSGVVCACVKRVLGDDLSSIEADYLGTNRENAAMNMRDLARLSTELDCEELAIVRSMFEARKDYLDTFWLELEARYGSFENFMASSPAACLPETALVAC